MRLEDVLNSTDREVVVHCNTREKATKLIHKLYDLNIKWEMDIDDDERDTTLWDVYKESTCYYISKLYENDQLVITYSDLDSIDKIWANLIRLILIDFDDLDLN